MAYARLITWQTTMKSNKGYSKAVKDTVFKNQNVGHAAIELVLPVNEETTKLMHEICESNNIPYYLIHHEVPKGDVSYSSSQIKVLPKKGEKVHSEVSYHVYFSFWPGEKDEETNEQLTKFTLNKPTDDFRDERTGRDFYGKNRNRDLIQSSEIEVQILEGKKAKSKEREYRLSPNVYHHDQSKQQKEILQLQYRARDIIIALVNEGDDPKKVKKIKKNAQETLNELDEFFPEFGIKEKFNKLIDNDIGEAKNFLALVASELNAGYKSNEYYEQLFNITVGDHGDHDIILPVTLDKGAESLTALDARKMLERMARIVQKDSTEYKLHGYNCSSAAGEVIFAGIQDEQLRKKFNDTKRTKMLPMTPQIARVRTLAIAQELQYDLKDNQKAEKLSPVTQSVAIIETLVARKIEKKSTEITKEKIVGKQRINDELTVNDIQKLIKEIKKIRTRGDIPIPSHNLNIEVMKIEQALKKAKQQGKTLPPNESQLLNACINYGSEVSNVLNAATEQRNIAMRKRKNKKKSKADEKGKAVHAKAKKSQDKGKEKIGKTKQKKLKPIVISIGHSSDMPVINPPKEVTTPEQASEKRSYIEKRSHDFLQLRDKFENLAKEEKNIHRSEKDDERNPRKPRQR
ncbi:hypothetical protein [Candidatus Berkiella aquae]|uniref:Uncharacterized protein n=1 Tax=Candidatus Berkiella aquae TaxID=295108 RepID=A0A0Q9Z2H4_9GAMM|nr:hypothetical protein [Candidatus Berkiella aquae]MCS5711879.1 hypothetical protein [Candidatus Berkiella aquae]